MDPHVEAASGDELTLVDLTGQLRSQLMLMARALDASSGTSTPLGWELFQFT